MKSVTSNRPLKPIRSEKGAVSVLAIMLLLLLTIAGIASLYTARTEIQIAGNERDYVSALTNSDAALNLVSQRLTNLSKGAGLPDEISAPTWVTKHEQTDREDDTQNHITNIYADSAAMESANIIDVDGNTHYSVIYWGRARGSSLDITQTKPLLEYTLYGFYNKSLGSNSSIRSLVESGYRNR